MESWQKAFLTNHLPKLNKETTVNAEIIAFLLADKVLGDADVQKLKVTGDRDGDLAKAQVLYQQLFTRTNGYKAIGRATFESKQSGAFILLLKGLVKYLLQQSNIDLEEETIDEILKAECLTGDSWQFFSAQVDKGRLHEDNWIEAPRPFYIPRHISNRIKLKPEVFKQNCSDVFIFHGLSRPELSKIAEPSPTAVSSQVISKNMTTIRFVVLEHEHHWNKLRSVWSEKPIHLIQFERESSDYILQNSTRRSVVVSNHVHPHLRDRSLYVPEEQFLTHICNEKYQRIICICDTPGMGKTWLLENMARQMKQRHSDRMIAVISLHKFVEQTQTSPQNSINSDKPIQILLKYLCPFRLTSTLYQKALEKNEIQLELFLDGFDEIPKEHVQSTINFIKSIGERRQNVNLFITSRPNMRSELEKVFQGVAYDILPFSEENQADFLVRFWQKFSERRQELNSERLRSFARECLNCFKKSLTKGESEMMGIPLQCLLLATVNLTNAELYCHQDSTVDITDFISPTTLHDMYTIYFEMGIDRAVKSKDNFSYESLWTRTTLSAKSVCQERQKLKEFHVWMALQLFYPHLAEDYRKCESLSDFDLERILACGFLQNCSSDNASPTAMTFVHRTFAEYLVAEHFAEIITCREPMNSGLLAKYIRCFVNNILFTQRHFSEMSDWNFENKMKYATFKFRNSAITYFLNANLQSHTKMSSSYLVSQNLTHFLSAFKFPEILSACITSSYANIIRLFKDLLKPYAGKIYENPTLRDFVVSSTRMEGHIVGFFPDQYYLSVCGYLCHAAFESNVNVLKELFSFFEECLHENLTKFCSKMPKELTTPLHYAVRRVDYSIVEYFTTKITLPGRRILFSFPEDGHYDSQNAIEICELLFTNDTSIIFEKNEDKRYKTNSIILHVRDVKLIKFLVQRGADVRALRIHKYIKNRVDNVLTTNAYGLDEDAFCELCQYLISEIKAYDLFTHNFPFWNDPLPQIISRIDDITLTSILQIPGINIRSKDRWGNNLVLATIERNEKLTIVKCLVDYGVDVFAKNKHGENALHLAVKSGNFDTTDHILSLGFSLEQRDRSGNTALHHAQVKIEMMKFLISKNANIFAANKEGNNIAHLVLKTQDEANINAVVTFLLSLKKGHELFKVKNKKKRTPLHEWIAYEYSNPGSETIELICQNSGEDVNAIDSDGYTMFLHAAYNRDSVACLKCLKKLWANHKVKTADGRNALHISANRGFLESIKYLVSIGASIEKHNRDGNTPLLVAAEWGNVEVMQYLVIQQANVLAVNNDGDSFAHLLLASKYHYSTTAKPIVEYLLTLPQAPQIFKMTNKQEETPLQVWKSKNVSPDSEIQERILRICGDVRREVMQ